MRYLNYDIVFQEIPGEISLAFSITGCPQRCAGCHSPDLWNRENGKLLEYEIFDKILSQYKDYISCVLFLGGEWYEEYLVQILKRVRIAGLKTALYTGKYQISEKIKYELDFVKLGPWVNSRGGLDSKDTNQILVDIKTGTKLNYLFQTT